MKKIFFTFLTVLLASLAAQAATDYGFEVAGVTVTSANCNNIVTNYITGGTVYYVPSSNTLYMNNVTITMTGDYNRVINNLECSDLKVEFSGTCNLYARDAAVVRIRRTTTLSAPSASTVVNITGVNENGIWLATRNVFDLIIQGPGTFNISSTNNTAIEDEENGSASHVDIWHNVYFNNVNAVLSSGGNSVVKRLLLNFKAGSSVRFKATNNSSYPVIDYCQNWDLYGNEAILEPYGAYYSNGTVYDSSGNKVYNQDVYVSDDYVAIINATNFPDANFRNYLLGLYPKCYITQTDVNNCTTENVSGKSISNLQGIKYFTALKQLICYNNPMTSLDVSGMTSLTYLDCAPTDSYTGTKLTSLNVSGCTNLETLLCYNTNIYSLSVDDCTNLKTLNCHNCPNLTLLSVINKSSLNTLNCLNCTALTRLYCHQNALISLDVTGCTALKTLKCYENANLATITGLADCRAITHLDCKDCSITSLPGVNNMSNITTLLARNNKLNALSVTYKSTLTNLNVRGNTTLTVLHCNSNDLTTLDVAGCTALSALYCFSNANLASITGLADCKAITHLDCEDCAITSLPGVNNMTNIATLLARNNKLTTLEVTNKSQLTNLRVSGNTTLTTLKCFNNALTSLDVTSCSAMTLMSCYGNQLTSLSVEGCTALKTLFCYQNKISGTGMTTLVNSLPTRSASEKGELNVIFNTGENNAMTAAQITTARNKYWLPKKYNGSAWVDMTASTRGDVNGDGSVNISDVTALIDFLLSGNASGISLSGADCNQDNSVNISDVTALIDYLLSGTWN